MLMSIGTHIWQLKTVSLETIILSDTKPDVDDLLQMENGLCLPSPYDHHLQRENYITLTTRAIVEIPSLAFLKPVVCQHIQHQYSKETRAKSEMVWYLMAHH